MRRHRFGFLVSVLFLSYGLRCVAQTVPASSDLAPGIVIEKVEKGSAAEKAGLREGDVLLSWSRGESKGIFESPFDLSDVNIEERPRGNVTIAGLRGAEEHVWVLGPECACNPDIEARPNFSLTALRAYNSAEQLLQAGRVKEAKKRWVEIVVRNARASWLCPWLLIHQTDLLVEAHRWTETDQLLDEASRKAPQAGPGVAAVIHRWWAWRFSTQGLFGEAIAQYQKALAMDLQSKAESLTVAIDLMGLAEHSREPAESENYLRQAIAIQERLAPASFELASSFIWASSFANQEGDLGEAENYAQRALAIQGNLPSNSDMAFTLVCLGGISRQRGDLPRAEKYFRQALSLEDGGHHNRNTALAFSGNADVAWLRGELPKAEYYERQALSIHKRLVPDSFDVAASLKNLSGISKDAGDLVKAEAYERRSLRIYRRLLPEGLDLVAGLNRMGDILLARGRLRNAKHYYNQALSLSERLAPSGFHAATILQSLGDLYQKSGDLSKAEQSYGRALDIWQRIAPRSRHPADVLVGLARLMNHRRQWTESAKLYDQALSVLEDQTERLGGGTEVRSGFRAKHQDPYREYVDLLVQEQEPERAFQVLERSRARSLMEMLSTEHIDMDKGVDPTLLGQERSLQQKLTDKSNRRIHLLSQKHSEDQIATLDKEIADLRSQRGDLEDQIRSASPAYAALTQPKPLSAKEVQQQLLDQDTALLEYSLGEERSYLFVLTPNALNNYELPGRKKIEHAARRVYTLLTVRNHTMRGETRQQRQARLRFTVQAYQRATRELSRIILPPAIEFHNKRLLIVTDGALAYIPFAALPLPGDSDPLMANHEIVYLPSASALAVLRQQEQGRKQPSRAVAVLADPVFSKDDPRVIRSLPGRQLPTPSSAARAVAPQDYDSFEADLPAHMLQRSIGDVKPAGRLHLDRLPFTREEAQAIASSVPTGQRLQALDFQASRSTATSPDLAQYRVVHLATHGLLDSRHPELSGLVLSLVDEHGQAQNGFLELQDIYNLNLAADLVVLSACETALGKEVDGEGLVGLTRGFMYAGASRVMASLWRVDDEATAQLMKKFYEGMLREGQTPAAALGEAQRWMQGQQKWKEPYYWAGFVLQGEWR